MTLPVEFYTTLMESSKRWARQQPVLETDEGTKIFAWLMDKKTIEGFVFASELGLTPGDYCNRYFVEETGIEPSLHQRQTVGVVARVMMEILGWISCMDKSTSSRCPGPWSKFKYYIRLPG